MIRRPLDGASRSRHIPSIVLGASACTIAIGMFVMAGDDFLTERYETIPTAGEASAVPPPPPWGPEPVHLRDTSTENPPDPPVHNAPTNTHDGWSNTHSGASSNHWSNSGNHSTNSLTHGPATGEHTADTAGKDPPCCPWWDRHDTSSNIHDLASSWSPSDVDIHSARTDTHSVGSDYHNIYSTTHKGASDVHLSASTTHRANSNIHSSNSTTHNPNSTTTVPPKPWWDIFGIANAATVSGDNLALE
ncbi:MAG: hypothetical protein AAFX05_11510 [Planctomycetota bacterium]